MAAASISIRNFFGDNLHLLVYLRGGEDKCEKPGTNHHQPFWHVVIFNVIIMIIIVIVVTVIIIIFTVIREGIPEKNTPSFGHCTNWRGDTPIRCDFNNLSKGKKLARLRASRGAILAIHKKSFFCETSSRFKKNTLATLGWASNNQNKNLRWFSPLGIDPLPPP